MKKIWVGKPPFPTIQQFEEKGLFCLFFDLRVDSETSMFIRFFSPLSAKYLEQLHRGNKKQMAAYFNLF